MLRRATIILAALALIAPARATNADPRIVRIDALPVVVEAGGWSTWVVALRGPWADATVDITIPAMLADASLSLMPYMKCSDNTGDSPQAVYTARCHVIDSPTAITIRGRVLVAPEPFCAFVVASELDYAAVDRDCQIVTGLDRLFMPIIGKGE